jgi:hypothetical protein
METFIFKPATGPHQTQYLSRTLLQSRESLDSDWRVRKLPLAVKAGAWAPEHGLVSGPKGKSFCRRLFLFASALITMYLCCHEIKYSDIKAATPLNLRVVWVIEGPH